jgi:hypothetical protein
MGGPGGNPNKGMPQMMGQGMPPQHMGMMPGQFQQPMPQAQPQTMEEIYLMRCAPLVKGVVAQNKYYKQQVGTEIFGFVQQLKGPKAPKITGMLIDLAIDEIHKILQNFQHFVMRVNQADELISQQQQQEQPAQQ